MYFLSEMIHFSFYVLQAMQQRRHEIDIHKDMLKAQIKSSEEERQTVRYKHSHSTIAPVSLTIVTQVVTGEALRDMPDHPRTCYSCVTFAVSSLTLLILFLCYLQL